MALAWDGTGYGPDGTIWGGEVLAGDALAFRRVARLRPFRLPGGEAAVREPRRVARRAALGARGRSRRSSATCRRSPASAPASARALGRLLATGLRAPLTSSIGRLFDGVAALAGLAPRVSFEGEAAMALEHAADPDERGAYPFELGARARAGRPGARPEPAGELLELDWRPLRRGAARGPRPRRRRRRAIAARFHNALADAAVALAAAAGLATVVLTGGCFQNRRLAESAAARLRAAGFEPWLPSAAPVNDGGIALGQIAVAAARLAANGKEPDHVPRSARTDRGGDAATSSACRADGSASAASCARSASPTRPRRWSATTWSSTSASRSRRIDEEEAQKVFATLRELGELEGLDVATDGAGGAGSELTP